MTFEHEAFHVEVGVVPKQWSRGLTKLQTLLYMLIQKAGDQGGTRAPPGAPPPDWSALTRQWSARLVAEAGLEKQLTLGPTELSLGHDDFEAEDVLSTKVEDHEFGWDNEHPKRRVVVQRFKIDRLPITNGEYLSFWKGKGGKPPHSWIVEGGEVKVSLFPTETRDNTYMNYTQVRTLYGPVSIEIAQYWPVMASYDELNAFARSKGGRIPTEAELRLFMDDQASRGVVQSGAGWGFQRWWLEPASLGNPARNVAPHNGGVWEWTSTLLEKHGGFESSVLYPGYRCVFCHRRLQLLMRFA
jgi:formylglycine-generating enzyme required for sulfatase activity